MTKLTATVIDDDNVSGSLFVENFLDIDCDRVPGEPLNLLA